MAEVVNFYEAFKDIDTEKCTPEWNIAHYTKLLSYTKHSVRRKKLQQELDWWLEAKEFQDKARAMREANE